MRPLLLCAVLFSCGACAAERPVAQLQQPQQASADAGAAALTWVDFAVAGCPKYEAARPSCQGPAPLDLRFAAVAPAPLASYVWSFSDEPDPVVEPTPGHRFRMPGTYSVSLTVGGAGGTAQARREMFITVTTAPEGALCEASPQCATGLECVCASGCGAGVGGFCARRCEPGSSCGFGSVCVDLGPRGPGDGMQGLACLRACARDGDCEGRDICREVAGVNTHWTRACFPREAPADEGASCLGPTGTPDDNACLGGDCAELGARGLCAEPCDGSHPCPSYALCAIFTGGGRRCLARCSATRPCDGDPFLACQASDATGALGFILADAAAKVCSPKRCTQDDACGPDGSCQGGFCVKRSG